MGKEGGEERGREERGSFERSLFHPHGTVTVTDMHAVHPRA